MTNQIRRSYKNDQSIISWLYYCVSWNYYQKFRAKKCSRQNIFVKHQHIKTEFYSKNELNSAFRKV